MGWSAQGLDLCSSVNSAIRNDLFDHPEALLDLAGPRRILRSLFSGIHRFDLELPLPKSEEPIRDVDDHGRRNDEHADERYELSEAHTEVHEKYLQLYYAYNTRRTKGQPGAKIAVMLLSSAGKELRSTVFA
jgi:hypothetical protein